MFKFSGFYSQNAAKEQFCLELFAFRLYFSWRYAVLKPSLGICYDSTSGAAHAQLYIFYRQLSQMFLAIAFFHSSEYILAVAIHGRSNVTLKSLLICKNYLLVMIISLLEYVVEGVLFPGLKEHWWISNTGLALVVIGEIIRKSAIITAGRAFMHLIKVHHEEHHRLVTHGVYRFVRHLERIPYEEYFLKRFFRSDYEEYGR
ncbi:Protein-S-isoprenylcysteine O-methyltransferase B [Hibiscus syriacus]|uniref:Protein-S-isoprenylcysteine O-methyltransferase n=1 Tax=Hibiscus syriacus TaxID=106335 RepID=A0A6A3CVZ7_HIBSY|nr:Protein-S-isoprenylcysteine O-methyltransferase B [Hibiscus syriacus]